MELHAQNPTTRFSDRVHDYARARPSYPDAAIDAILDGLAPPASLRAADIGAGTGISASLLAARGCAVVAIEPNAEMRAATQPHPRIECRDATAERTGLTAASIDLVVCAQSFHWFRGPDALAEFARILRKGGRLALMWNDRDDRDWFTAAYTAVIQKVAAGGSSITRPVHPDALFASTLYQNARELAFPSHQLLDEDGVIARALSASYIPKDGPTREYLRQSLGDAVRRHADAGGRVRLTYITRVFLAESR